MKRRRLAALGLLVAPALALAQAASPRRTPAPAAPADVARLTVDRPTVVSYFVIPAGAVDTSEEFAVAADDWSYAMATLRDSLEAHGVALALVTQPTLRLTSRGVRRPVTLTLGPPPASGYVFVRPGARPVVRRGFMDPDSVLAIAGALLAPAARAAPPPSTRSNRPPHR